MTLLNPFNLRPRQARLLHAGHLVLLSLLITQPNAPHLRPLWCGLLACRLVIILRYEQQMWRLRRNARGRM